MEGSPFNRSGKTRRSPPPTPAPDPAPEDGAVEMVTTSEIQHWMSTIEHCLNEICTIAAEGKLNSDQKLRINNLCRKVGNGTSQMAVQYQGLKKSAVQAHISLQALKDKHDLSQQLQDLKQSIEESSKSRMGTVSFADMVKRKENNFIAPNNVSAIAIYPNDKQQSSEETKSLVQKLIRPENMKLQVRGLRKTRHGGVIISTDSKDDVEKLKQSVQLSSSGLTVDEPYKRKPRIIIIGVPASMQESEVFKCVFQQNLADKIDMTLETFLTTIKLSHKSGKMDAETCNYIIEVPAHIRKALITQDRVFVHWRAYPVRDFTLVSRCFKCQQYGHVAKTCRQTDSRCGHCGDLGHIIDECTKKMEPPKCATCSRFKKPNNHKTGDAECPAKLMAEKRYINTVDYVGA